MKRQTKVKHDPKETKEVTTEEHDDIAEVVSAYLPDVMRDRKNMQALEKAADDFYHEYQTPELRKADAKNVMEQLTNAKLALESLYNRLKPLMES